MPRLGRWRVGPCCGCEPAEGCRLPEEHCGCALPPRGLNLSTPVGDVTMAYVDSPSWTGWWGLLTVEDVLLQGFNPSDSIDYAGDDGLGFCHSTGTLNVLFRMTCDDGGDYPIRRFLAFDDGANCRLSRGVLRWTGAPGASRPYLGVPWHPTGDYGSGMVALIPTDEACACSPLSVEFKFFADWQWNNEEIATLTLTL